MSIASCSATAEREPENFVDVSLKCARHCHLERDDKKCVVHMLHLSFQRS